MRVWLVTLKGALVACVAHRNDAYDALVAFLPQHPHYAEWLELRGLKDGDSARDAYLDTFSDDIKLVKVPVRLRDVKPLICMAIWAARTGLKDAVDAALAGRE